MRLFVLALLVVACHSQEEDRALASASAPQIVQVPSATPSTSVSTDGAGTLVIADAGKSDETKHIQIRKVLAASSSEPTLHNDNAAMDFANALTAEGERNATTTRATGGHLGGLGQLSASRDR